MAIRTVANLKQLLKTQGISPEALGESTNISNMTLRRLIKKPAAARIPSRYHVQLDFFESGGQLPEANLASITVAHYDSFKPLIRQIAKEGAKHRSLPTLKRQIQQKLKDHKLSRTFSGYVKNLLESTTSGGTKARALSIGALLYFINPFDLIPDAMMGVGYLDDFAVLSLISALITSKK